MKTITLLACFCLGYGLCWYNDSEKLKKADLELIGAQKDMAIEDANWKKELDLADRVEKARDQINKRLGLETSDEQDRPHTTSEALLGP